MVQNSQSNATNWTSLSQLITQVPNTSTMWRSIIIIYTTFLCYSIVYNLLNKLQVVPLRKVHFCACEPLYKVSARLWYGKSHARLGVESRYPIDWEDCFMDTVHPHHLIRLHIDVHLALSTCIPTTKFQLNSIQHATCPIIIWNYDRTKYGNFLILLLRLQPCLPNPWGTQSHAFTRLPKFLSEAWPAQRSRKTTSINSSNCCKEWPYYGGICKHSYQWK